MFAVITPRNFFFLLNLVQLLRLFFLTIKYTEAKLLFPDEATN